MAEGDSGDVALTGSGTLLGLSVAFGFVSSFFFPRFQNFRMPADIPVLGSCCVLCGASCSFSPAVEGAVEGVFSENPSPSKGTSDVLEPGSLPMALSLSVCVVAMLRRVEVSPSIEA